MVGLFHSSLNIPINYPTNYFHPMALLPSITSFNIADLFTRPLPINSHHRYTQLIIGDDPIAPTTSATSVATASTTSVATATVAPTVVASAPTLAVSDSVPFHPNSYPAPVIDTGASHSVISFASDFTLEVSQASYGLFRSPISVVSKAPVDPYTLITGEDVSVDPIDLSSSDTTTISDLSSFTKVSFDIRQFGTASLTFIYSKASSELLHIFVDPNQIDWLHWVPLPRLTPTES